MHPRDDQAALESQRDELRRRLDEATRKADELRRATQGHEALEEELARVEERLAQRKRRRVPLLEDIRIASPCTTSWEAMTGDDRVRFCGECQKNVYNLSAMAREEAERLLAEREGSICVRLYQREDGTVLTADCPVGVRRKRVRLAVVALAGATALSSAAILSARTRASCSMGDDTVMMGAVAPAPRESYVEMPLPAQREPGVVLVYWRESPGPKPVIERWKLHTDGRIVHEIDSGPGPRLKSAPAPDPAAVAAILALADELSPYANGILWGYEDSAVHAGFELYGTGQRAATRADTDKLLDQVAALKLR